MAHSPQNRGEGINLAPCRHARILEQLGYARARAAQAGETRHLRHICAAETAHGLLTHRAQDVAAIAGKPLGVVRAHTGPNGVCSPSALGLLLLLRFRRVISGVRRLQRLRFQGFLRGPLIAATVCHDVPIGRQDADEHNDSLRSSRNREQTPARKPTATADHRATAPDKHAIVRNTEGARIKPRLVT